MNIRKRLYHKNKQKLINFRLELIKSLGNRCSQCGYSANCAAICFHHKNPTTKLFTIDISGISHHTKEEIINESLKCILLCQNCHAIHHENERNTKISQSKRSNIRKIKQLIRKQNLINKLGGCCSRCKFTYNGVQAFTFHHIDKYIKSFPLDCLAFRCKSDAEINKEVSKCKLLCFNCHMETEHPNTTLLIEPLTESGDEDGHHYHKIPNFYQDQGGQK